MNIYDYLEKAIKELQSFYDEFKNLDHKRKVFACDFFCWIKKKTRMIMEEGSFSKPEDVEIKRGHVFWIDFGVNIGEEFGGRHPGIILRKGGNTVVVVPLSTQTPTKKQEESGTYVKVDRVYGFKKKTRWVNVLNVMPISIQRIDFGSSTGDVKGYVLDEIAKALKCSGVLGKNPP